MSENATYPGEKIASIEEYEAGYNAFDDGDMVRAATIGQKDIDKTTRTANINHPKNLSIPKVGDVVIGTVAAVTGESLLHSVNRRLQLSQPDGRYPEQHLYCNSLSS